MCVYVFLMFADVYELYVFMYVCVYVYTDKDEMRAMSGDMMGIFMLKEVCMCVCMCVCVFNMCMYV